MTTSAWIMLALTWSVVGSASIWLVYRVLTTPPRNDTDSGGGSNNDRNDRNDRND